METVSTKAAPAGEGAAFAHELEIAVAAAKHAGAIQRDLFGRLERITLKGRRDIVTEADFESEAAIIAAIRGAFPHDAIVAEESGAIGVDVERAIDGPHGAAAAARAWFIDPLDGTVNFANGIPIFCSVIGLAIAGRPTVGVVYDASRDELLWAVRGQGALRETGGTSAGDGGAPALRFEAGSKTRLEECLIGLTHQRGFLRAVGRIRPLVRAVRDLGSASLAIAYVGGARLDAYIQPRGLSPWDVCAPGLIAEEGGATVTALDGAPWFRSPSAPTRHRDGTARAPSLGILAAGPMIHPELLRLVRG